jgi:hypothetical protein
MYDKFEILNINIIKDIFNKNILTNNFSEIIIINEFIMITFPYNFNQNNKYIAIIGTLNDDNIFLKKYILIFDKIENKILNKIKSDFNNYIKGLSFLNNSAPIIDEEFNILGTIVHFDENETLNQNNNINNNIINNLI